VQYGCQGGGHRSFTIGAGDMDALEFVLGIVETRQNISDGPETQFNPESSETIHGLQAFIVCHMRVHGHKKPGEIRYRPGLFFWNL
jgi:hypothetical protein